MKKYSPGRCRICGKLLNSPKDPTSKDCGNDCVQCVADFGDPDAIEYQEKLKCTPVAQSVIVIGPQACGKTRFAEQIAQHYGLPQIVDEGKVSGGLRQVQPQENGVLYLTNRPPPKKFNCVRLVQFDEIARALNLKIEAN